MNLSFLPGDLHLTKADSDFVVRIGDQEILVTKSERAALAKFRSLRAELEKRFPAREPTPQERAELLQAEISNSLLGHNSLGGRRKKSTGSSTRTFGG